MHEEGIVKSVDGMMARVAVAKRNVCSHCESDSCDISESGVETEAINLARAKEGQKVKLALRSGSFVKGAIFLYIIPLLALFLGAVAGKAYLPSYFAGTDSDLLAALGAFVAFILSVVILIVLSKINPGETSYQSVVEEILE